jgi:ubiquinone/menaquinone biosynthesis C-methylase UbiE
VSRRPDRWNLNIHYHRLVLDAVPPNAVTALDVGCGNGLLSFDLAARGLDVVGVDPHAPSIERAINDPEATYRATFICADVFTHPFEPSSFDVVASSAMLHHVDAERGLRRMRELVRPGGVVVIVGFAMPSSVIDRALITAGFVVTTTRALRGRYWEHDAPVHWPPPRSIDEMRALVERELPGARFRRRMAHRYSIVWTAPQQVATSDASGHHERTETHALGYERVDDDPHATVLVDTMDATARWPATQRLRAWERQQLRLVEGQRLLDVGCGLGEAALALGEELGTTGEVVGVDRSAAMLRVARATARAAGRSARFSVGDACALDEPTGHFDVVRSERTLQWIAEPMAAIAEMARVVRPGGLISLIDTDWSTLTIDVGDDDLASRVREAMRTERNRPSNIGSRLHELVETAGLTPLARTAQTHTWTTWDPEASPAPDGCFSMESLADDLVDAGQLASSERSTFAQTIRAAAARDQFTMSLTMFAVVAVA